MRRYSPLRRPKNGCMVGSRTFELLDFTLNYRQPTVFSVNGTIEMARSFV
jgi:hypothetical protein